MLKYNKSISSNGLGNVIVTLKDGRCACVDINKNNIVIEVLLDSFFKWGAFDKTPTDKEIEKAKKIILDNEYEIYYGPQAKEYLLDKKVKDFFDDLKKELDYDY